MSNNNKKYYAFISYRHSDNKIPGRQWASWLHHAIETYQVPEELVGTKNSAGDVIPSRIFPIFRDEEELPTDADLGRAIVNALDSSRLLIVLCSPRAVSSTYVADEIHHFKQQGHSDRIIAAMIDGEPNASWDQGKQKLGYKEEDECFPIPLQFEYDETGNRTNKRAEPIAADFRLDIDGKAEQSWTSVKAYTNHLKKSTSLDKNKIQQAAIKFNQQQHLMLLKIIAGILGIPLGELTQRDKEYQLEVERNKAKVLKRWLSGVFVLALVAIAASVFAYFKQQQAVEQQQISELRSADSFVANGYLLTRDNKISQATESLIEAIDIYDQFGVSKIAATTQYLFTSESASSPILDIDVKEPVTAMHLSSDSRMVVGTSDGNIKIIDQLTGSIINELATLSDEIIALEFSQDNLSVVAATQNQAVLFELENGNRLFDVDFNKQRLVDIRFLNSSDQILIVSHYDEVIEGVTVESSQFVLYNFVTDTREVFQDSGSVYSVAISPDEKRILVGKSDGAKEIQLSPATLIKQYTGEFGLRGHKLLYAYKVEALAYSKNDRYIAAGSNDGVLEIWDQQTHSQIFTSQYIESQGITSVEFSSQAPWEVVVGSASGIVHKVSQFSNQLIFEHQQRITAIDFPGQQSKSLFSSSLDGHITLVNASQKKSEIGISAASFIGGLDYSEDGQLLMSTGLLDEEAKIWDSHSGEFLSSVKIGKEVFGAVFDLDPTYIWVATEDAIERRNILTGKKFGEVLIENNGFVTLKISPDRQHLFMNVDRSSEQKQSYIVHLFIGQQPISSAEEVSKLSYETIATLDGGNISLASTTDASIVVAASDSGTLHVWHRNSHALVEYPLAKTKARIDAITISHSGKQIITGHVDGKITLIDIDTGQEINTIKGNETGVVSLWISPDDRWLISAERAGAVRLWELSKGKQVSSFGRNPITTLQVHEKGRIARGVRGDNEYYGDVDVLLINPQEAFSLVRQTKEFQAIRESALSTTDERLITNSFDWYLNKNEYEMAAKVLERALDLGYSLPAHRLAELAKQQGHIKAAIGYLKKAIGESNDTSDKVRYQLMINSFIDPEKFMKAIRDENNQLVEQMLELGIDPNFIDDYTGKPPLQVAVEKNNFELLKILLENGSDINYLSRRKETALFDAVTKPRFWKLLIEKKINIHQLTGHGRNILHRVAFRGDLALLKVLLANDVDTKQSDGDGLTPLKSAHEGKEAYPEFGEQHWKEVIDLLKPSE